MKNLILSFLYGILQSNLSVFLKGNNSIKGLMTDIAMFDCFFILFVREKSHKKKATADKNVIQCKSFFIIKQVYCTINYLCRTANYELCIKKYSRVFRLFIDT